MEEPPMPFDPGPRKRSEREDYERLTPDEKKAVESFRADVLLACELPVRAAVFVRRHVPELAKALSLVLLLACRASAEPILTLPTGSAIVWTGTSGVVSRDAVNGPIRWTSTEHLRNACFAEWATPDDDRATDDHARSATCVHEDFLDGLFVYTLDLSQIALCEKAQPDTEWTAGGTQGVWIVVMASRMCGDLINIGREDKEPSPSLPKPVPESASGVLIIVGLLMWALFAWWRAR